MPSVLTTTDRKVLSSHLHGHWTSLLPPLIFSVMALIMLWGAASNLQVASAYSEQEGQTLMAAIERWYAPKASETYSGFELLATKRVEQAFGKCLLALVFGGLAIPAFIESRRMKRIAIHLHTYSPAPEVTDGQ